MMIHIGMSDLTASSVMSCYNLAVNNDSAADTSSKRYHDHIRGTCCCTLPCLTKCCYIGIISCFRAKSCHFFQLAYNILISPVKVYCTRYFTFGVHWSRGKSTPVRRQTGVTKAIHFSIKLLNFPSIFHLIAFLLYYLFSLFQFNINLVQRKRNIIYRTGHISVL